MHLGAIRVKPQSHIKAVWQCDKCPAGQPHVWTAVVQSRTRGAQCPYCCNRLVCSHNSLATIAPGASQYWNHSKNEKVPEEVLAGSNAKVEWKCPVCNLEWQGYIKDRVRKRSGCPQCSQQAKSTSLIPHLLKLSLPAWPNGTMSAMMLRTSTLTKSLLAAGSRCTGSAHAVQEGSHTAGQQHQPTA